MTRIDALVVVLLVGCGSATNAPPTEIAAHDERAARRVAIGPDAEQTDATTIVGHAAPPWEVDTWMSSPPITVDELRGRVVLVRWFADDCPYCLATAPSLTAFHDELAAQGLSVVGLYHHKIEGPLVEENVRAFVQRLGFRFPVAIDRDWRTLHGYWLDDHPDSWTSVSFLIDRRGIVRFVHTGGSYAPGSDDEAQMRAWIEELLAEAVTEAAPR